MNSVIIQDRCCLSTFEMFGIQTEQMEGNLNDAQWLWREETAISVRGCLTLLDCWTKTNQGVCVSCACSMLCPASCLPLLRELAQWRCLLGWHRHHGVGSTSAAGLSANTGPQQQGSEVKGRASRPVGRTKPLPGSQVSPGPSRAPPWEI